MTYEDLSQYDGEWKMDLRHGEGSWKRTNGICYSGSWENDQSHGEGTLENEITKYKYTGTLCSYVEFFAQGQSMKIF